MKNIVEIIVHSIGVAAWIYIQFDVDENISFKHNIIRSLAKSFVGTSLGFALINAIGWF